MNPNYEQKYLKYKTKYLALKLQQDQILDQEGGRNLFSNIYETLFGKTDSIDDNKLEDIKKEYYEDINKIFVIFANCKALSTKTNMFIRDRKIRNITDLQNVINLVKSLEIQNECGNDLKIMIDNMDNKTKSTIKMLKISGIIDSESFINELNFISTFFNTSS